MSDQQLEGDSVPTRWWHRVSESKVQCDICPRYCHISEGQRGLCFVRGVQDGEVRLYSYGRSSGFCIDPIEKKPLNHFLPGTPVLSFGTAGCNLACRFCQNWDMSKSREMDTLTQQATPEMIALSAKRYGCRSIAFTYNDPVIFHEYAIDCATAAREQGIKSVAVSAGYVCPGPRSEFYQHMDAANIDLKAFSERFYHRICGGHLEPVLDTLEYLRNETDVWFELTTLLIPEENDSDQEIREMSRWIHDHLGPQTPLHFSAFHPDWKMLDKPPTPPVTLSRARRIALDEGLLFVYTGNVHDPDGGSTWCPGCGALLIERDWYRLGHWGLDARGCCANCGDPLPGVFEALPGDWGARRQPIRLVEPRERS
ncbi:AmmeMemoRadiSam system radical SAM enzyme [Marinobacterium zhoushanense]|uniref:AmmeMemoRadiSam system radical SAM enzyme n=1 Tax=Marinobacterium zhoushanense TaxID=1679163 RepID=A0ABQ1K917_9GAMM|nr:AmmeMemoRadiSam system radical SAM enzyme [Marinobacterium zhoushanense]GGB90507.1 AmmeMemoRadiSam system radical SAM enzyme [Marinobacterium zhoushanense]